MFIKKLFHAQIFFHTQNCSKVKIAALGSAIKVATFEQLS